MARADADIIVVGAGHNTLTAAAYLARCGLTVLVLERNSFAGGGAISRELTRPGFVHDCHATNVNVLQRHPVLAKDELDLKSKFGVRFSFPPISYMAIFSDGQSLATYADIDATCEEIAKYSAKDAEAYRTMIALSAGLAPVMGLAMFRPPISMGALISMLERIPNGSEYIRLMFMSGYEFITELFENLRVQLHFLRWAGEMLISPFEKTSSLALLTLLGGAHAAPGGLAIGGTQALTDAMIKSIVANRGVVRLNATVAKIINDNGTVRRVMLENGEILTANKAVIAAIHPHLLGDLVEGLDPGLVARAKKPHVSRYGGMSVQFALNERPNWISGPQAHSCLSINLIDVTDLESLERSFVDLKYKRMPKYFTAYANVHTNHDPSRAPAGKHILNVFKWAPFELADNGVEAWDRVKEACADEILTNLRRYAPNLTDENILARTWIHLWIIVVTRLHSIGAI